MGFRPVSILLSILNPLPELLVDLMLLVEFIAIKIEHCQWQKVVLSLFSMFTLKYN